MIGSIKVGYNEDEIAGVDQLAWFQQAYEQVRRMEVEEARQNRALICWHHLYRWPEIRRAAWAAYTKERYDFLMYLADHAGPDAVTHRAVLPLHNAFVAGQEVRDDDHLENAQ